MKIKLLFTLLLCFPGSFVLAQKEKTFKEKFQQGLLLLGGEESSGADAIFEELYANDSSNLNLAFLLGQSYAKGDRNHKKAIWLLNKAKKGYSKNYKKLDYREKRVSEYVFYYLLMAYSKAGKCDQTLQALNDFYMNYSYENEWYLVDAQKWFRNCKPVEEETPENIVTDGEDFEEVVDEASYSVKEKEHKEHLIGTKEVSYTYKGNEYGVQVGAFVEPVYTYEFPGLRNIEVYVDQNGVYRYIIGRFMFDNQAERLLKAIKEKGYEDAFVTNIKNKQKFSEQVLTIDRDNINKRLIGRVDFRVQIGAFRGDTIPDELMEVYLQLDSISEVQTPELTIMTVGSFDTYEAASFYKELVQDLGVEDAFVAAFNYNRKVDLKQAILYIEEQKEAIKKRSMREAEIYDR